MSPNVNNLPAKPPLSAARFAIGLFPLLLAGCCIAPNAVRLQAEHVSHASQHVDGSGCNFGAELVGVVAHWQARGWFVNAEESYNLSQNPGYNCPGGICGNREVFQAQAGYEWRMK